MRFVHLCSSSFFFAVYKDEDVSSCTVRELCRAHLHSSSIKSSQELAYGPELPMSQYSGDSGPSIPELLAAADCECLAS